MEMQSVFSQRDRVVLYASGFPERLVLTSCALLPLSTSEAADAAEESALKVKIAVYASFYANCALAILQLYAAVSSLSLSLFATAIDSVSQSALFPNWPRLL